MNESTKRCTGCGETKPLTDYPIRSNNADSRDTRCRKCRREADKHYKNRIAATSLPQEGYAANMRHRYEKSRAERPRCTECGAKVNYSKASQPERLCERCEKKRVDALMAGRT